MKRSYEGADLQGVTEVAMAAGWSLPLLAGVVEVRASSTHPTLLSGTGGRGPGQTSVPSDERCYEAFSSTMETTVCAYWAGLRHRVSSHLVSVAAPCLGKVLDRMPNEGQGY